jgi:hypothetical protein
VLRLRSHDWLLLQLDLTTPNQHDELAGGTFAGALPIKAHVGQAGKVGDLIGTFWPSLYVVTERFRKFIAGAQLTGWHAYPLDRTGPDLQPPLWVLGISGRSGPVFKGDAARQRGWYEIGHYLDPSQWDGSDMFRPSNEGTPLLTARAAKTISDVGLRNVALEPAGLSAAPR